jgi:amino acid permease
LSVIALVVFGAVNYLSAYIIVYYQREGEDNLMKLLERLTNKNCARFFTLLVAITAATGSVIYFLLMTRCAYTVFTYIIYLSTHDGNSYASADSKKLVFDQFSIQY